MKELLTPVCSGIFQSGGVVWHVVRAWADTGTVMKAQNRGATSKATRLSARLRLAERRELRQHLPHLIADVAALVGPDEAIRLTQAASTLPSLVRSIGEALRASTGLESRYRVAILGTLSDLALMHADTDPKAPLSKLPLSTPVEILYWFAAYLEETLDRRDLRLTSESTAETLAP